MFPGCDIILTYLNFASIDSSVALREDWMSHDRQSALIKPRGKCINYCTVPVTAGEVSWVCIWLEYWLWCTVEDSIILNCPNHSFIYLTQADYSFALMALEQFSLFKKCYILSSKLQIDLFYSFKTCYCASISIKPSFHTTIMSNHKIIVTVDESIWFNLVIFTII